MALSIRITNVTQLYPEGYYVQWTLDDVNPSVSGHYQFKIFRSGGSEGPWEPLAELLDQYSYFDQLPQPPDTKYRDYRRPNVFGLNYSFFYKIEVTAPNGSTAVVIDEPNPKLEPKQAGFWRKATRDFQKSVLLAGTPAAVLKRRRWGLRCKICLDKITRESLRSACINCYGTGFEKGYWDPIPTRIRRSAPQGASQVTPEQRQDGNDVKIHIPRIPNVEEGDLIVFTRDNKRYIADQQVETQITLTPVHQVVSALEIPRDNIIYRIKIDTQSRNPIL
jgi:hypothetical protein